MFRMIVTSMYRDIEFVNLINEEAPSFRGFFFATLRNCELCIVIYELFFVSLHAEKQQAGLSLAYSPHRRVGERKVRAAQGIPLLNGKEAARLGSCRRK